MRKGQKVRVKSSNKIGVIADTEFFHWGGRKHVRYEVKIEGQKNTCWYPKEDLSTDLAVRATIVFRGENGTLNLAVSYDCDKKDGIHVEITGEPENLKEHRGLHSNLAYLLIERLTSNS